LFSRAAVFSEVGDAVLTYVLRFDGIFGDSGLALTVFRGDMSRDCERSPATEECPGRMSEVMALLVLRGDEDPWLGGEVSFVLADSKLAIRIRDALRDFRGEASGLATRLGTSDSLVSKILASSFSLGGDVSAVLADPRLWHSSPELIPPPPLEPLFL